MSPLHCGPRTSARGAVPPVIPPPYLGDDPTTTASSCTCTPKAPVPDRGAGCVLVVCDCQRSPSLHLVPPEMLDIASRRSGIDAPAAATLPPGGHPRRKSAAQ